MYENGLVSTTSGGDSFISSDITITGTAIWVDSVNGNNSYAGTEEFPLATLAQAITNATASNGDLIILKSGHTETLTANLALSKAGLKILGLGSGSSAPNFKSNANIDLFTVSAAGVELNNLYFLASTTATCTARIDINAANCRIKGCTFLCGAFDQNSITITASGLYASIISCSMSVTADGPDAGVIVESASAVGLRIESCSFSGGTYNWDDAAIYSASAHTNFVYDTVTLTNKAHIIHTAAAKGYVTGVVAGDNSQVRV